MMNEPNKTDLRDANVGFIKSLNTLAALIAVAVAVFSVNLALVNDPIFFFIFLIFCATASSWLFTVKGSSYGIIPAIVGWTVSIILTHSAFCALLSISYLPYAVTLWLLARKYITRSSAIGISSAVITVISVAVLLLMTYRRVSDISLSAIVDAFPEFFSKLSKILYSSFAVKVAGESIQLINASNVNSYLYLIIGVVPGIICAVASFAGYLVSWLYNKFLYSTTMTSVPSSRWSLCPSAVSAVFFVSQYYSAPFQTVHVLSCLPHQILHSYCFLRFLFQVSPQLSSPK